MNCHKFEDYLNEQLDLDKFKVHMETCNECLKAYQIDQKIMRQSRNINKRLEIPDLWSLIEKTLQIERPVLLKFKKTKRLLIAAAAALLILTTIWMFNSFRQEKSSDRILSQQALERVIEAEENYQEAIKELEELAYTQLGETTEPLAQLYRNKLSLIDRQIENCKAALEKNPANSHIRQYLMAALQDKRKTLENILKLNS